MAEILSRAALKLKRVFDRYLHEEFLRAKGYKCSAGDWEKGPVTDQGESGLGFFGDVAIPFQLHNESAHKGTASLIPTL